MMLLAFITLVGHVLSLDGVTVPLMLTLTSFAVLISGGLLPLLPTLLIFIYQISVKNSPAIPSFSDYYFTGWRLPIFLISLFLLIAVCIYTLFRSASFRAISLPDLKASIPLALAFLFNGAISGEWSIKSLGFGALQIISFFLIGYFFYLGLEKYSKNELIDYFSFVCTVICAILVIETLNLYLYGNVISGGTAEKGRVLYGWGIWTTAGMDMAVLIPIAFMRAARSRHPIPYLVIAHLTYASAVLTLSRNALVFGTLALIFSALIYALYAPKGRSLLKVYVSVLVVGILSLPFFFGGLAALFRDYLDRGLSDNGRIALWKYGIDKFLEAPIFGKGFYAINPDTFRAQNFFPTMLHNTAVELLAAMGMFGFFSYVIYRVNMLRGIIKCTTRDTAYILISMLTLLLMSLFDNFVFYIQPMFLFAAEYAIIRKGD